MAGNRRERIARVIREESSRVILFELADPRIGFVTVTKVKVSADLSHARVYVSVYGDGGARERTMRALSRAARVVQRSLGPRLKTRLIPHVEFEFDPSVEGAIHMSQLITEARASDPDGGPGSDGGEGTDAEDGGGATRGRAEQDRDEDPGAEPGVRGRSGGGTEEPGA